MHNDEDNGTTSNWKTTQLNGSSASPAENALNFAANPRNNDSIANTTILAVYTDANYSVDFFDRVWNSSMFNEWSVTVGNNETSTNTDTQRRKEDWRLWLPLIIGVPLLLFIIIQLIVSLRKRRRRARRNLMLENSKTFLAEEPVELDPTQNSYSRGAQDVFGWILSCSWYSGSCLDGTQSFDSEPQYKLDSQTSDMTATTTFNETPAFSSSTISKTESEKTPSRSISAYPDSLQRKPDLDSMLSSTDITVPSEETLESGIGFSIQSDPDSVSTIIETKSSDRTLGESVSESDFSVDSASPSCTFNSDTPKLGGDHLH